MLSNFTGFIEWLLTTVANFLGSEPIIYLFYMVLSLIVIEMFVKLLRIFI